MNKLEQIATTTILYAAADIIAAANQIHDPARAEFVDWAQRIINRVIELDPNTDLIRPDNTEPDPAS
ncbi:MAG: hypothetical protein MRY63_09605 [Neomegalonema sp.]|nr:hypothetical protein [Neomegalonema sp.]